jgi:diguanylate cyclase (GGDEF)-like protein
LGLIDFLTGYEISFAFFYLIPVAMLAWFANKNIALLSAFISAITWQLVNRGAGEQFSNELIPIWNTLTRLGFFVIVAVLLLKLKTLLDHESKLARTDDLTGAENSRSFYETAELEMSRSRRYGRNLTVCYFDADNFKQINDTLGHQVGSELLIRVVKIIKENLRSTDIIGRLGGDEFALLLPETNQEQARVVISKIREKIQAEMNKENWAVTFSMGVLTCIKVPETVDELISVADSLMYEVKKSGKNSVKYEELNEKTLNSKQIEFPTSV